MKLIKQLFLNLSKYIFTWIDNYWGISLGNYKELNKYYSFQIISVSRLKSFSNFLQETVVFDVKWVDAF